MDSFDSILELQVIQRVYWLNTPIDLREGVANIHYSPPLLHTTIKLHKSPRPKHLIKSNLSHVEITFHKLPLLEPPLQAPHHRLHHLPRHSLVRMENHVYRSRMEMEGRCVHGAALSRVEGGLSFCHLDDAEGGVFVDGGAVGPEFELFVAGGDAVVIGVAGDAGEGLSILMIMIL